MTQINIVGKILAGALNKEGVISPNHPGAIELILTRSRQTQRKKKLQVASSQEKAYKLYTTGREVLSKWEGSLIENSAVNLTSDDYKHLL
jgi:hypothetical protein